MKLIIIYLQYHFVYKLFHKLKLDSNAVSTHARGQWATLTTHHSRGAINGFVVLLKATLVVTCGLSESNRRSSDHKIRPRLDPNPKALPNSATTSELYCVMFYVWQNCIFLTHSVSFPAWGNLGNVLKNQGKVAEAEQAYRNALYYRRNMADMLYNLYVESRSLYMLTKANIPDVCQGTFVCIRTLMNQPCVAGTFPRAHESV